MTQCEYYSNSTAQQVIFFNDSESDVAGCYREGKQKSPGKIRGPGYPT